MVMLCNKLINHDLHTAMLMGAAEKLTSMKNDIAGTTVFISQPTEEGDTELKLKEGLFTQHQPDLVFGIHVWPASNTGHIRYREGPLMASLDRFEITIKGSLTHGTGL